MAPPKDARRVTVSVTTLDGKDNRAVPTYIEVDRGAGAVRVSGKDLVCNKEEATFDLLPGQSLTIEGFTAEAIAFDREQSAAYRPDQQSSEEGVDKAKLHDPKASASAPAGKPLITPAPVKPVVASGTNTQQASTLQSSQAGAGKPVGKP